ncbi:MAG: uroporphyrinogen decarboxylase family protein [Candidatus Omnitrophica bacterium]|nr:uroporphyrinogen decarboxylase family protein [Candidatus Omnitrophota bacterium]
MKSTDYQKDFAELRNNLERLAESHKDIIAERKERLVKAENYQEPDRVPVVCRHAIDWWLQEKKISWTSFIHDAGLQIREGIKLGIYNFKEFGADIDLPSGCESGINVGTEVVESSVLGCRIKYTEDDYPWLDLTWTPISSPQEIKDYLVPEEAELEHLGVMPQIKKLVTDDHGYGFKINGITNGEGPFEMCCFAYGTNNFLLLLKEDSFLAKELLEKMTQLRIRQGKIFKRWFDRYNVTVGENNIDMISPNQFAEFVFPYDRKIFEAFPEDIPCWHTDACADRILELIPEYKIKFFEVSDTTNLKLAKEKLSPHRIVLTGNLPQRLFVVGTKEEMEREVIKCIEAAASGGGYILTPNSLMRDAKKENMKAMIDAVKKYGKYL